MDSGLQHAQPQKTHLMPPKKRSESFTEKVQMFHLIGSDVSNERS